MKKRSTLCIGLLCLPILALSEAPVVDLSGSDSSTVSQGSLLPAPERAHARGAPVQPIRMAEQTAQSTPASHSLSDSLKRTAANVTNNNPLIGPSSPTLTGPPSSLQGLPLGQRMARVEQQLHNLAGMNSAQQISQLRQQLQQLSGELQVQQHDIQLLNQQLRSFYQDLQQQIKSVKNLGSTTPPSGNVLNSKSLSSNLSGATSDTMQATAAYKAAFHALKEKNYPTALSGFQQFLSQYPKSKLVVNAYFWIGEIHALQNHMGAALDAFQTVISRYPKSDKVRDAKLKVAIIRLKQGKKTEARQLFTAIKQQYPGTTAAQLADIQLQQMQQSN